MSQDIATNYEVIDQPITEPEAKAEDETTIEKPIISGWSKILVKPPAVVEEPSTDKLTPEQVVIHVVNDPIIDSK